MQLNSSTIGLITETLTTKTVPIVNELRNKAVSKCTYSWHKLIKKSRNAPQHQMNKHVIV